MKRIIILIILFFHSSVLCFASASSYQLLVNGKPRDTIEPIFEQNGEVFLSVCELNRMTEHHIEIRYNHTDRSVVIITNGQYSYFKEGYSFCIIHNKIMYYEEPPFLEQEIFYLPVSACAKISEHFFIKSKSYLQFFKW
ncbi:MAG: hypothetical protein E7399_06615 [Ruminococcaceae bacterium]|nr:hypothetical protein [Oscillospiraceae bacterium]